MRAPDSPGASYKRRNEGHASKLFTAFITALLCIFVLWVAHAGSLVLKNTFENNEDVPYNSENALESHLDASFLDHSSPSPVADANLNSKLASSGAQLHQQHPIEGEDTTTRLPTDKNASNLTPKTIVAVLSRYRDDIKWLESNKTGIYFNLSSSSSRNVSDNATASDDDQVIGGQKSKFIMPLVVYQAADIALDGFPTFPGLADVNSSDPEAWPLPGWPEWALDWAQRKNATKALGIEAGSFEDAEREVRLRLGLPVDSKLLDSNKKPTKGADNDDGDDDNGPHLKPTKADNNNKNKIQQHRRQQQQQQNIRKRNNKNLDNNKIAAKTETDTPETYIPGESFDAPEESHRSPIVSIDSISSILPLHIVPNRGAEAMSYISYIIENYDTLPDVVLFMHGHRSSWHMSLPQDWTIRRLATHPPSKLVDYVPLGCQERALVKYGAIFPTAIDANFESPNGPRWHEALAARFAQAWREHLGKAYGGMELPDYVAVPCGASFAATREAIQRRPLSFYTEMREWLLTTTIEGKWLGIVMEFTVGLMMTGEPVVQLSQEQCLCNLYDVCSAPADI